MIIPAQLRAARALVGWTQADLAAAAFVSEVSVKNIEKGSTDPRVGTLRALTTALEQAGVQFIPENGGGAGVRLFKEPLIGWMQCATPQPGDFPGIQEPFENQFMATGAPEEAALFCRTSPDHKSEIYLISAAARRFVSSLRGDWGPAQNPSLFGWSLLVGRSDAHERLKIRPPRLDGT